MARSYSIKKVAIIGAGDMGGQIAAMIANSNTPVLLLDMVPRDNNDRDALAKKAIAKLRQEKNGLDERKLNLIQPGNIEDDLEKLAGVDWVIECVSEKLEIKQEIYRKIGKYIRPQTVISSNTSTIPLSELQKGLQESICRQLCVTHFFNPPSKMPLMELVTDQDNATLQDMTAFINFASKKLGRNVVQVKDMPGFIANHIGMFWLLCAMEEAKRENLNIETADAVMGEGFGFPKTGIFGLADLIGLELIPELAESMCRYFPEKDEFCQLELGLLMIKNRLQSHPENPLFYNEEQKSKPQAIHVEHWHSFLNEDTPESRFACNTLVRTLAYTAEISPAIADNILQVDAAMRDGYGWKYGPFEMMDRLGVTWLMDQFSRRDIHIPILLKQAQVRGFYRVRPTGKTYLELSGRYRRQKPKRHLWTLDLVSAGQKPILQNGSAKLYDVGDGIACFTLTKGKIRLIDEAVLDLLVQAIEKAESSFKGIIIGHDEKHFSAGLDLYLIAEALKNKDMARIDRILKQGQDTMLRIKRARVPVVPALSGYVLGGACELVMHCPAAQAHSSTRIGLVETGIGVIPAWGGTKEHLFRVAIDDGKGEDRPEPLVAKAVAAFRQMASAQKSRDAEDAFAMGLLRKPSGITMNRERLLPDAKALCLKLALNYVPKAPQVIHVPVEALYQNLEHEVRRFVHDEQPRMSQHRYDTLLALADTLSGHRAIKAVECNAEVEDAPCVGWDHLTEEQVMETTREAFVELVQDKEVLEHIQAIIKS